MHHDIYLKSQIDRNYEADSDEEEIQSTVTSSPNKVDDIFTSSQLSHNGM